jgi:apolipoprotein N-acyltransferase
MLLNKVKDFLAKHPQSVFESGISSHRFYKEGEEAPAEAYTLSNGLKVVSYNSAVQVILTKR